MPDRGTKSTVYWVQIAGVALTLVACSAQVQAQDATSIVKKMIAAYKNAKTIHETAEAKVLQLNGRAIFQQSEFYYKAPNEVVIATVDPLTGTLQGFCDGHDISLYSGKQNIFTRRPAIGSLHDMLTTIANASEESLGMRISQVLSPVSFLAAKGDVPDEAVGYKLKPGGPVQMDGHTCYEVHALANPDWVQSMAPKLNIAVKRRDIIFWIDTKTNLLVRAGIALTWLSTVPNQPRTAPPKLPGGFAFEEVHRGTQIDSNIPEKAFRFFAPKGAIEKFPRSRG
jgi:hypothetical protein